MKECIKLLEESLKLSHSLIGEIILTEKSFIDNRYSEEDFFNNYIQIASILDKETEKIIYQYATKLKFFLDPFKNEDEFLKNIKNKDYKALFITPSILKNSQIYGLANNDFTIFCLDENTDDEFSGENIKFINKNKRVEYLNSLKELRLKISKNYKKRFYLEIIKQNHELEFSNYLALKSKLNSLRRKNGEKKR